MARRGGEVRMAIGSLVDAPRRALEGAQGDVSDLGHTRRAPLKRTDDSREKDCEPLHAMAASVPLQPERKRLLLGQRLVERKWISAEQLSTALAQQQRTGEPLGRTLVELGFLRDDDLARDLAEELGVPFVELRTLSPDPGVLATMSAEFARSHGCFPLRREGDALVVALANPANFMALDEIKTRVKCRVTIVAASQRDIHDAIGRLLEGAAPTTPSTPPPALPASVADSQSRGSADIVDRLLQQGLRWGATDIHVEPEEKLLRVRYRIDGMLARAETLPKDAGPSVLTRIKVLSALDITERRRPQDGRLKWTGERGAVDMRVSIMPTMHGENAVLRVLDRSSIALHLDELGIVGSPRAKLDQLLARPQGMLLVSGPTGSGKTTTLYACLLAIDSLTRKVVTIEDPIEYQLPLIRQSQVDSGIGYAFADGLRTTLRQDPDVILIGEIRDRETADTALKASLTGHLVLSSIHTNSAVGVVTRLLDLGMDRYLVANSLSASMAQRLLRRVCSRCRAERSPNEAERVWLGASNAGRSLWEGRGCGACHGTGYAGRTAVYELFVVDSDAMRSISSGASELDLIELHRKRAGRTMLDDARDKVLAGATTVAEVLRVCTSWQAAEVL